MTDHLSLKCPQRQAGGNESILSCSFLVRSMQKTPDCLMGHAIVSGHLAQGFVLLTDTVYHVWPCFRWDGMLRPLWTCMLLCGDDWGKTAKHVLERKESVIELAMRSNKMNQHW